MKNSDVICLKGCAEMLLGILTFILNGVKHCFPFMTLTHLHS